VLIHTSPEDLLTDQTPSSAANALALPTSTNTIATTWRIPLAERMLFLSCPPSSPEG
jgi:hypothetical protein